jgi:eukaryotic-like serine/threonine-protein kinase
LKTNGSSSVERKDEGDVTEAEAEAEAKATVAGKYELARLIGRGGMGSVWEGRHVSLGTRVAIKFIESAYAKSDEARSRFDREAHAAASIRSKHAIQIFDHGVTDEGQPYIVMELLEGESLAARLETAGRLSIADTARILRQIGRALTQAHEVGIVHRDLKPENIFLVRDPESPDDGEIAKVLDFGIAKIRPGAVSAGLGVTSSSTRTGTVIGTPHFMSPEQARGLRTVDHRTDIWALGAIAYRCVVGRLAFDGETIGDLLVRVCTDPLPIPSRSMPELAPSFDTWLGRALDRNIDTRFATVRELCDALDAIAHESGGVALGSPSLRPSSLANAITQASSAPSPTPPSLAPPSPSAHATSCAPFTTSVRPSQLLVVPLAKPRTIALRVAVAIGAAALLAGAVFTSLHRPTKHDVTLTAAPPPPPAAASTLPRPVASPASPSAAPAMPEVTKSGPTRAPQGPARRFRKPFDPKDPGY